MHTPHTRHATAPTHHLTPVSSPSDGYDWQRFGRHGLRAPYSAVVDLPIPTTGAVHVWVSTLWPDSRQPGGWARMTWEPDTHTARGWRLPERLAAGDVLEFGADTPHAPVRWYGIMDSYHFDWRMTVQGPYEDPAAAFDTAQRLLGLERFQPALEPQHTAVVQAPTTRPRQPRSRLRRRHRRP